MSVAREHRYGVEVRRMFNCFDAWVATETVLYVEDKHHWKAIRRWEYDALLSRTLSEARAKRKARRLMETYGTIML